jgi:hypothetical protein
MDSKLGRAVLNSILVVAFLVALATTAHAGTTIGIDSHVKPSVEINVSMDDREWLLSPKEPGSYAKVGRLNIRSNSKWMVTAKPEDTTDGRMTEWSSSGYGDRKLSKAMTVKAGEEVALPNEEQKPIQTGTKTGSTPAKVDFVFAQEVTKQDIGSSGDRTYRMVVTFTGAAMS